MFRSSFERPIVLITKVGRHSNLSSDEDDHMDRVSVGSAGTFLLMPGGVSQAATCDLILFYVFVSSWTASPVEFRPIKLQY